MSVPPSEFKKSGSFKPSSKKEWIQTARQELGEGNSIEKLVRRVDGIDILPYYAIEDLPSNTSFQIPAAQNDLDEARSWVNAPRVFVKDALTANVQALKLLNTGANGILFDLQIKPDLPTLLRDIELAYCSVYFLADTGHKELVGDFIKYLDKLNQDQSMVSGAFFWKQVPGGLINFKKSSFKSCGIVSSPGTAAEVIAHVLEKSVRQLESSDPGNTEINSSLQSVAFSIPIGTDFFLEIAKLKALRSLWYQIVQSCSPDANVPAFIHADVTAFENKSYDPHGEMLRNTTAALSAVLGGCDALTIAAEDPASVSGRIALNISSVLRHESHLARVADPTAGSYYIEQLADSISQDAWRMLQTLLNKKK